MDSVGEELERLARLRVSGDLTDAEYELLKTKLIQDGEITALDQEEEVDGQEDASEEFLRRVVFNSSPGYLEWVSSRFSFDDHWSLARSPYLDDEALPQWEFVRQFPDYSSRSYRTTEANGLKIQPSSDLADARLNKAFLSGVDLSDANLKSVRANKTDLSMSNLRGTRLMDSSFRGSNFEGTDLSGAWLSLNWNGKGPDFTGTNLNEACLVACDGMPNFKRASLRNANFQEANLLAPQLQRTIAVGASFARARLEVSDFSGSVLGPADFVDAYLMGAQFNRANLAGARFARACLSRATFSSLTEVNEAIFTGADLSMTDFSGMEREGLEGADLRGALADSETKWPKGFDPAKAGVRFS